MHEACIHTLISSGYKESMINGFPVIFHSEFESIYDFHFATILCSKQGTKHWFTAGLDEQG